MACKLSFTDGMNSSRYRHLILGDELKLARLKAGLTQEQVAARARISREYVSQLERNRQSPTVSMLLRVSRILGIPAARLIAKVENPPTRRRRPGVGT